MPRAFCCHIDLCRQYAQPFLEVLALLFRYFHPSPPAKTVRNERTFEGISLDTPGQSGKVVTTMSRFQLCPNCYEAEAGCALWPSVLPYNPLPCPALLLYH